ncbi:LysR family transcriptional regulator [Mycolicibacterium smegmatis]|uniref:LysR family transcriptional regulator n=1 Tax=Mycolicibacterium smegmatis TaxID=1772 RepID=UPI001E484FDB|nr:LysR family transcriptional regulator [Mycolicibacterium smegmatis]UGU34410.1 LysR family transcriptional regulator [Mycolicibacterium smegmatis]ULN69239.1 LysR family transcriptional regulator [Mycolicibacterium smegmatis]
METPEDLELRSLRLVLAVARERSFTRAAQHAHLSQSALSRVVGDVERRLGTRLFERTTRSVETTAAGREFVRIATGLLRQHEQAMREFTLFRDGEGGIVRIAVLPSFAATMLPPLVAQLRTTAPQITLDIHDTLAHNATGDLLAGRADIAITSDDDLPEGVQFTAVLTDRFYAVHREDHHFAAADAVRWSELAEQPLAAFGPASSLRALTDATFTRLGLQPRTAIEAENIAVVAGLVAAGLGVAAVPATVIPLMSFAGLTATRLVEPQLDRTLGLVSVPGRSVSAATARVAREIAAISADFTAETH